MKSHNYLGTNQDDSGRATVLGFPLYTLDGDEVRKNEEDFDSTLEIHKFLSSTGQNGKNGQRKWYFNFALFLKDVVHAGDGHRP